MKAIQFKQPGGPEVLELVEVPTPVPGPGEVLIKAHAIGVGMPEVMVRKGAYPWMPPLPAIPGIEMSGTVVQAGATVSSLKIGQAVFVSARELKFRGGCYAEYLAAEAGAVYLLPASVDLDEAAALSNYQVAYHLLHSATRGFRFDSILAWAAAGGVGSAIVQLARAARKRLIAVVDTAEKAEFARSQGAEVAINFKDGRVGEEIQAATSGRGVDLILDPIGGPGLARNFDYLAPLGMLVSYGFLDGPPVPNLIETMMKKTGKSLAFRLFSMHAFDAQPELRANATRDLLRLFAQGEIKPVIYERVPLAEAKRAHELLESGRVMGKLIMKP